MNLIVRIQNRLGEKLEYSLKDLFEKAGPKIWIGNTEESHLRTGIGRLDQNIGFLLKIAASEQDLCRDLTPGGAQDDAIWIYSIDQNHPLTLGNLTFNSIKLEPEIPVQLEGCEIQICSPKKHGNAPDFPENSPKWLTSSESGRNALWKIKKSSTTELSIYLCGETGVGKDILARLIHDWSDRQKGPFVPIHCGALTQTLAESELFGHTKGAFTGAHQARLGALRKAHKGTLFLDEIADLSPEIQIKLLRFLENGEIRPLGSDQVYFSDVRIVCATHFDLEKLVEKGQFRQDLYFRLASLTVQIPPLRQRPEDIELLAKHFAKLHKKNITRQALSRLKAYDWPGNVRELKHIIEQAVGFAQIPLRHLHDKDFSFMSIKQSGDTNPNHMQTGLFLDGIFRYDEMEKALVLKALHSCRGNRSQTAQVMGIARSTLFEMIKRHKIVDSKSAQNTLYSSSTIQ